MKKKKYFLTNHTTGQERTIEADVLSVLNNSVYVFRDEYEYTKDIPEEFISEDEKELPKLIGISRKPVAYFSMNNWDVVKIEEMNDAEASYVWDGDPKTTHKLSNMYLNFHLQLCIDVLKIGKDEEFDALRQEYKVQIGLIKDELERRQIKRDKQQ